MFYNVEAGRGVLRRPIATANSAQIRGMAETGKLRKDEQMSDIVGKIYKIDVMEAFYTDKHQQIPST